MAQVEPVVLGSLNFPDGTQVPIRGMKVEFSGGGVVHLREPAAALTRELQKMGEKDGADATAAALRACLCDSKGELLFKDKSKDPFAYFTTRHLKELEPVLSELITGEPPKKDAQPGNAPGGPTSS